MLPGASEEKGSNTDDGEPVATKDGERNRTADIEVESASLNYTREEQSIMASIFS